MNSAIDLETAEKPLEQVGRGKGGGEMLSSCPHYKMRYRTLITIGFVFLILGFPSVLRAAPLLIEAFSYLDGPLVTAAGSPWVTHSGTAGELEATDGHIVLSALEGEDVNALLAGQPYPATTNTVLYASFTVRFSSLPLAGGEYFAHFKDGGAANYRARLFALTGGAAAGQFRLGLANASNAPSVVVAQDLSLNVSYRAYLRYAINAGVASLWIDPAAENSPAVTATDAPSARTVVAFAVRQATGVGVLEMDDLRVGTAFADVFVAPELLPPTIVQAPANTTAIEGGSAVFTVVANGPGPLAYQWRFNNALLADATNATLTLENINAGQAGDYTVTVSNAVGSTNSLPATLTVLGPASSGVLTLVTYNVKGNFASDWTTNAAQVQAIGRQLIYLQPDIITFNEIPNSKVYEMTNFVTAFLPGYFLATNSGTDGSIRSVIASRYPIARSQKWLDGVGLTNFGYAGTFTRDLFEAQISVPGASEPLHVYTSHLKSGSDGDSQDRRAAECAAVSNFFATVFIPSNGYRPYVLTGDLNEDINLPMSHNNQPIQTLTSLPTGLHVTTPLNPFTLSRFTHSIQGALDARFDYILPSSLLFSNIAGSQVFRTDLLPPPLPPPLLTDDDITASDHLPVVMVFRYPDPALLVALSWSNETATLTWPALVGRKFTVEASSNLIAWTVVQSNLVAGAGTVTWTGGAVPAATYYRVVRVP